MCFACLVASLVLLEAYFSDRNGGVDELGLMNPPYMLSHYGKLTYTSYAASAFFDQPVIVHPPIHTLWIGLLWRLGFTIYYAEATPTVLLFLLCIAVIVRGAFPDIVKLGLLFSVGYVMVAGEELAACFGTRPEGELHATWLCGLVLLESGRLGNWNQLRLAAGAFLLTWASGVHYYAGAAFTGVAVYAVWAVRSLGWKEAKSRLAALAAGGCLFGIPYLIFYLLPYSKDILAAIRDSQGTSGVAASIHRHEEIYRAWSVTWTRPILIRIAMSWKVPLVVYSTIILMMVRSTRGLALAALPLQLFLYLFASHKQDPYLVHESAMFAGAVAIGGFALLGFVARRMPSIVQRGVVPAAAILLTVALVARSPMLAKAKLSLEPRIHEAEVARAAAREILRENRRVGGDVGDWFASGASDFYNIAYDIRWEKLLFDPRTYLSNLDAIVDCTLFCGFADSRLPSAWYADGTVKLRGFYFGETNDQLKFVFLNTTAPAKLVGYGTSHGQLYRFQQEPAGDYEVLSAICPKMPNLWEPETLYSVLNFSMNSPDASKLMVTVCARKAPAEPVAWMNQFCRPVSRVSGSLSLANRDAMVAKMRQDDQPIHFYRTLDQVPGYVAVGLPPDAAPPPGAVRLDGAVDVSKIVASSGSSLEPGMERRLNTAPFLWAFAGWIPLTHPGTLSGPGWIELRLRVLSGRVGFFAFDGSSGGKVLARTLTIGAGKYPQTIALAVPDFRGMTDIIIDNESTIGARVDVLDVAVLVKR